jgi:hypothetical protein
MSEQVAKALIANAVQLRERRTFPIAPTGEPTGCVRRRLSCEASDL